MSSLINKLRSVFGGNKVEYRYSVQEIVEYFLAKQAMTPKKLQKIIYFAYSWYLAMMNDGREQLDIKLFDGVFEAWIHGPVCPSVYRKYKEFGASSIPKYEGKLPDILDDDREILEDIWQVYGDFTANELESISHQHAPWKDTREKNNCSAFDWCCDEIDDEIIFDYYIQKLVS